MKKLEFQKLENFLSRKKEVRFAYLFGSNAKNKITSLSDIDLAVYFDDHIKENERFNLRLKLLVQISNLLKREDIDLIILNDSDISLAYEVVRHGKLVCSKDELKRIRYEARIMGLFFDRKYYYDRHARLLVRDIAKEGIL